jgi:hypothetical protein
MVLMPLLAKTLATLVLLDFVPNEIVIAGMLRSIILLFSDSMCCDFIDYTFLLFLCWQIEHMSGLVDFLRKWQGLADSASVPIPTIGFNSLLMTAFQFSLVEFQGFFLSAFSGVGHVALMGFFNPEDS